jgi:hypothetical protein
VTRRLETPTALKKVWNGFLALDFPGQCDIDCANLQFVSVTQPQIGTATPNAHGGFSFVFLEASVVCLSKTQ